MLQMSWRSVKGPFGMGKEHFSPLSKQINSSPLGVESEVCYGMLTPPPCMPPAMHASCHAHPPGQNDRHLWKHSLSATTVADGNNYGVDQYGPGFALTAINGFRNMYLDFICYINDRQDHFWIHIFSWWYSIPSPTEQFRKPLRKGEIT